MRSVIDFSVVIPTYHRAEPLLRCLRALSLQSGKYCPNFEVIVVDDGSPVPVLIDPSSWSDRLNLRVIRQENSGPAAARNRGAEAATGRFLAFTDDDCLPDSGWLDALAEALSRSPDALVGTATRNGISDNLFSEASHLIIELVYDHFNGNPDDAYFLTSNNFACSRSNYLDMGGFDTDFPRAGAEDRDFCDRWRLSGRRIRLVPLPLVEHRHSQTLSKFLDLHYRYGQGAFVYQAKRRERCSGTMREDLGFHQNLLESLSPRLSRQKRLARRMGLVVALLLWQLANAAGFLSEYLERIRTGGIRDRNS